MIDFRGAHFTAVAALGLIVATFTSQQSSSSPSTTASLRSSSSTAFIARNFALPVAWTTIAYLFLFGRYGRLLERRFGTSRFVLISTFLGTSATLLSQSVFSAFVSPFLLSSSSSSNSNINNNRLQQLQTAAYYIPVWNPILLALSTFVALRVPSSRRTLNTLTNPIARRFLYPYSPVIFSTVSVFLNHVLQANRSLPSTSGSSSSSSNQIFIRAAASTACSLFSGVVVGALLQYYKPMMEMLNNIADSSSVSNLIDTVFRSGRNEFYVRQQGAPIVPPAAGGDQQQGRRIINGAGAGDGARNLLHGDDEEDQIRQAIAASLREGGGGGRGGAGVGVGGRGRGGGAAVAAPIHHQQQGAAAAAVAASSNSNAPMTAQERESINFLKEMIGGGNNNTNDQQLLQVLRSCHGDANQAASVLLGM